jgi:hypothetical protein
VIVHYQPGNKQDGGHQVTRQHPDHHPGARRETPDAALACQQGVKAWVVAAQPLLDLSKLPALPGTQRPISLSFLPASFSAIHCFCWFVLMRYCFFVTISPSQSLVKRL